MLAQNPRREHRHQRTRQKVRRCHGKPDRKRERDEERAGHTGHEKRGDENRQHAQHREQARDLHLFTCFEDSVGPRPLPQVAVNVLHHHCGLIHKNANGERQSTEGHDVDRLSSAP